MSSRTGGARRSWSLLFFTRGARAREASTAWPSASSGPSRAFHSQRWPVLQRVMSVSWWRSFSISTLQCYFILNIFTEYAFEPRLGTGYSMLPTLAGSGELNLKMSLPLCRFLSCLSGDSVLGQLWKSRTSTTDTYDRERERRALGLSVGDLAVYISPNDPSKEVCKRVIGLSGDTVLVEPRIEPSLFHELEWITSKQTMQPQGQQRAVNLDSEPTYIVVPKGHIWTSGDNLANSIDSRHYGPVPLGLVRGKLVAKIWPFSTMCWLYNPTASAL
ncbi:hypothetical protein CBS101457_006150 [Exobasidium rhododendri]|nr:hypothetical protein CBS101457_006150 [Exobasidium rhododendri]